MPELKGSARNVYRSQACQRAWDVEPDFVPDESRLRLSSRYCSFATTLLCKPIKHGLTIYCMNFCRSRYLYNFEWFTGKQSEHGKGQPTDKDALNEDSEEDMAYVIGLMERLITKDFDGTGATAYTDKAFTSIKLARLLAKRRLALVGMLRTLGRPKLRPRGNEHYWPFRHYSKAEMDAYIRGYRREAHVRIGRGDVKWLNAQLWRDARFVTLITTAFFSTVDDEALRWEKSKRKRVPVSISVAIKRYNKYMGAVDHFNKELAKTHMQMGRCKQRFHRSLFLGWLLPAVGVVNVRTAFCELVAATWGKEVLDKLKRARGVGTTSFAKWFQLRLGELLIEKGGKQATEANGGEAPHFMPDHRGFHWKRAFVLPTPPELTRAYHPWRDKVDLRKRPRAIPIAWDKKGKQIGWLGGGGAAKDGGRGRCQLCSIRALRLGKTIRKHSRRSYFACKCCRVILCRGCWDLWDHYNERAPPDLPPMASTPAADGPTSPSPNAGMKCPKGHELYDRGYFFGNSLWCNKCDKDLSSNGQVFLSCDQCDYDVCIDCCEDGLPSAERARRAEARAQQPSVPAERPKPTRLPSKTARSRAANKLAKGGHASQEARRAKKQRRNEKLKAARAAQQQAARGQSSAAHGRKRSGDRGGSCDAKRRRRSGR